MAEHAEFINMLVRYKGWIDACADKNETFWTDSANYMQRLADQFGQNQWYNQLLLSTYLSGEE